MLPDWATLTPEEQDQVTLAWQEAIDRGYLTTSEVPTPEAYYYSAGVPSGTGAPDSATVTSSEGAGGTKGNAEKSAPKGTYDLEKASDPNFYKSVEINRRDMNQPPPPAASPAPVTGDPPIYDDNGQAVSSDGGGGSSRRRSSGGGSGGGGGTATDAAPAQPAFPGGGFGTPNSYPTLPMTPQRQKVLQNLSGPFGPNVGTFRTPPGGWREDMAPMFTTGAFGGVQPPAESSGIPGGPPMSAPAPAPAMPDYSAFMAQPAPAPAPNGMPALPDPTLMPPGAEMGITPPDPSMAAPAPLPAGFPAFNRPGFVAPGSPAALQMQRRMPQMGGNAAPLPASLRQRFGL